MDLTQLMLQYDFSGKTVVIIGGIGVLGGEMTCGLVGLGANVAVLNRNPEIPEEYRTPMDTGHGRYLVLPGDVLDPASIDPAEWQGYEDEGVLYVPKAGETLYRMKL